MLFPVYPAVAVVSTAQPATSPTSDPVSPAAFATQERVATAILRRGALREGDFDPAYLKAIPLARMQAVMDYLSANFGPFERLVARDEPRGEYMVVCLRGRYILRIALNVQGKISGFALHPLPVG